MSGNEELEALLPEAIRRWLERPERAKNEKVTVRFDEAEFEVLKQLAHERGESVSALVRKLALARLDASRSA